MSLSVMASRDRSRCWNSGIQLAHPIVFQRLTSGVSEQQVTFQPVHPYWDIGT